jgi:molecular chaperone GrpE
VNLHEALMRQPAQEGVPSNQVLDVLENGYKLGERVIRHAKVIVSE